MNESEKHEIQAIREDIAERHKEIKDVLLQLQESFKRGQKVSSFRFVYELGLTAMIVGMTLTGLQDLIKGLLVFRVGLALCLIGVALTVVFRVKSKLKN